MCIIFQVVKRRAGTKKVSNNKTQHARTHANDMRVSFRQFGHEILDGQGKGKRV